MQRDRLSLAGPMAIIVVISVELAALNWGTGLAVDVAGILTVMLLGTATYQARCRTGREGEWWFGFALFGWSYYILLLETMALSRLTFAETIVNFVPRAIMDFWASRSVTGAVVQQYIMRLVILDQLFTLAVAVIGGTFCLIIGRNRERSAEDRN